MNRSFRTFAGIALGGATLALAATFGVAHAQVPPSPVRTPILFSVNLDAVNSAPQFQYNSVGAQIYVRFLTVNVYEQNQMQFLPGSEFVLFSSALPRNLPTGRYVLTINAMPGPAGATFTAYNPVANMAYQNGSSVGSCTMPKGDFKTLVSCTMVIPTSPFAANTFDLNVTNNNSAWFRNMTVAYEQKL